jgi:hypothetical protein
MTDGRGVNVTFQTINDSLVVTETFEVETNHPLEAQRNGWQSILDRFKKHVEGFADCMTRMGAEQDGPGHGALRRA